jgi:hypothetical protein
MYRFNRSTSLEELNEWVNQLCEEGYSLISLTPVAFGQTADDVLYVAVMETTVYDTVDDEDWEEFEDEDEDEEIEEG